MELRQVSRSRTHDTKRRTTNQAGDNPECECKVHGYGQERKSNGESGDGFNSSFGSARVLPLPKPRSFGFTGLKSPARFQSGIGYTRTRQDVFHYKGMRRPKRLIEIPSNPTLAVGVRGIFMPECLNTECLNARGTHFYFYS